MRARVGVGGLELGDERSMSNLTEYVKQPIAVSEVEDVVETDPANSAGSCGIRVNARRSCCSGTEHVGTPPIRI